MAFVTLQGMDEAMAHLNPNSDTLKGRLAILIRSYFPTEESVQAIVSISAEDIIRQLWEIDDPEEIRQKKKNLSGLKSSLNKTLKELAQQGQNPEGLIIGRDNVFTISDEHKNDLLQQLGITGAMAPHEVISVFRELLTTILQGSEQKESATSLLKELEEVKEMIARTAGISYQPSPITAKQETGSTAGQGDRQGSGVGQDGAGAAADPEGARGPGAEAGPGLGSGTDTEDIAALEYEEILGDEETDILDQAEIIAAEAEDGLEELPVDLPEQGAGQGQPEEESEATLESAPGAGVASGPGPGLESGMDAQEIPADDFEEILVDEETDILDQAEITAEGSEAEVDLGEAPMAPPRQGTGPGQAAPLDGGGSGADAGPGLESGMDAEEIPVDDFEEILVDEEMDILDQAEIIAEGSEAEAEVDLGEAPMAPPGQGTGPGQAGAGAAAFQEGGGSRADAGPGPESGMAAEESPADDFEEILGDEEMDILDQAEVIAEGSEAEAEVDLGEASMAPPGQGTGPGQAAAGAA
ncbi:MAG: hypothetical protein HY885_18305, partial [Deltaproteobacteria bacterium]|nr:hypothetical protein [Deltaproteobacteria bacterium]